MIDKLAKITKTVLKYHDTLDIELVNIKDFELSGKSISMIGIDGSYIFLFSISGIRVGIVKVVSLRYIYENHKYILQDTVTNVDPIVICSEKYIYENLCDEIGTECVHLGDNHADAINDYRTYLEQKTAYEVAEKSSNNLIVLDGTLSYVKGTLFENLIKICEKNNHILVGISKDSYTHAFNSYKTDEELLASTEYSKRCYIRAPKSFEIRQKGVLYGDVYFVKLHPRSEKWFRVDVGTYKNSPSIIFSYLADYSMSRLCLGYPYPMVEAHRNAVSIRKCHKFYGNLVISITSKYGVPVNKILKCMTHLEGQPLNAFHGYLDKLCR